MVTPVTTIAGLLATRALELPDRVALRSTDGEALSYEALHATSVALGQALRRRGIAPGDRVALALPNGLEAAVAFLAVASAATCAPLHPGLREADFAAALDDLRVAALVACGTAAPAAIAAARERSLPILALVREASHARVRFALRDGEADPRAVASERDGPRRTLAGGEEDLPPASADVALVLQTSGTTARPKVVPLTHRNLVVSAANVAGSLRLGRDDVCLNVMPLFHVHGLVAALLASLHAGASVVCTRGFHAGSFAAWLRDFAPTWYTAVPTIHQAAVQTLRRTPPAAAASAGNAKETRAAEPPPAPEPPPEPEPSPAPGGPSGGPRLRFVRSSSAALPARLHRELEELFGVPVIEAYGMTEASHQMASNPVAPGARRIGSVGPAAGPEIAVLDESGRALARGAIGEIAIRGETVTRGYENAPEANAAAFAGDWFRTGDQGYVDDDGFVYLTGRLKELINRGGEKIAPREVEEALLQHAAVAQAVAFAAPHARLGEDVAAAVVLRDGAAATPDELRRDASALLADFKVPRRIAIVPEIPKGPTGKVQRSLLASALGVLEAGALDDGSASAARPAAPLRARAHTPLERSVAACWAGLLGLPRPEALGVEDDFFDLGGDSLAAVELLERMREVLGLDVPIADFLERPTIAGLLELRERCGSGVPGDAAGDGGVVPLRIGAGAKPIFCTTLHDGSLWRVGRLMRLVPVDCAVYGFRAPPVGAREPLPTIESLAERYLAALESVQPEGPVRLVGPCFGGTVALEMAIRLERAGRPVELLAMVNSFNRGWRRISAERDGVALRARHLVDRVRLLRERLEGLTGRERLALLRARADLSRAHWTDETRRLAFEVATRSGWPRPSALRKFAYVSRRAQRLYAPATYGGSVLLVRTMEPIAGVYPLPHMGWAEVLAGDVEVLELPGEQLEFWGDDEKLRPAALRIGERLRGA